MKCQHVECAICQACNVHLSGNKKTTAHLDVIVERAVAAAVLVQDPEGQCVCM